MRVPMLSLPVAVARVWLRLALRLAILLGFALCVGACSKCDVPDWFHRGSPPPPHSCHDDAPLAQ